MSLTGDPITDTLVPIAQRFVGAVRYHDGGLIEELLAEAIAATGGRCDPGAALAVVCAAMVPDEVSPSELLAWRLPIGESHERYLRRAHAAHVRGERVEWVVQGEREYQRLRKARNRKGAA